jgi:hypothetical protein
MFGCFRRLGCLVFLLILAIVGWFNRDRLERLYRRYAGDNHADSVLVGTAGGWEQLSLEKADRGKKSVESLSGRGGPAYVNLTAAEASSYIFTSLTNQLPAAPEEISTSVRGEKLYVRANLALKDLGAAKALGPLAGMLGSRDTVELGGTMRVIRPTLGEFKVTDVKIGAFPVPSGIIPRLMRAMRRGSVPEGIADDALPMTMPAYIGDIRISGGRITVYRTTQ